MSLETWERIVAGDRDSCSVRGAYESWKGWLYFLFNSRGYGSLNVLEGDDGGEAYNGDLDGADIHIDGREIPWSELKRKDDTARLAELLQGAGLEPSVDGKWIQLKLATDRLLRIGGARRQNGALQCKLYDVDVDEDLLDDDGVRRLLKDDDSFKPYSGALESIALAIASDVKRYLENLEHSPIPGADASTLRMIERRGWPLTMAGYVRAMFSPYGPDLPLDPGRVGRLPELPGPVPTSARDLKFHLPKRSVSETVFLRLIERLKNRGFGLKKLGAGSAFVRINGGSSTMMPRNVRCVTEVIVVDWTLQPEGQLRAPERLDEVCRVVTLGLKEGSTSPNGERATLSQMLGVLEDPRSKYCCLEPGLTKNHGDDANQSAKIAASLKINSMLAPFLNSRRSHPCRLVVVAKLHKHEMLEAERQLRIRSALNQAKRYRKIIADGDDPGFSPDWRKYLVKQWLTDGTYARRAENAEAKAAELIAQGPITEDTEDPVVVGQCTEPDEARKLKASIISKSSYQWVKVLDVESGEELPDVTEPIDLTARTPAGTFRHKTKDSCTHVVVVGPARSEGLEAQRQHELRLWRDEAKRCTQILETRVNPEDRTDADRERTAALYNKGFYGRRVREAEEGAGVLLNRGEVLDDGGWPWALAWCDGLETAQQIKVKVEEVSWHGMPVYRWVKVFDVAAGHEVPPTQSPPDGRTGNQSLVEVVKQALQAKNQKGS
jgi:hypothetical protein